ncbi:transposable element Tcb1 transposase [Trichonephila clavipes]|nr:transposable element Tcb1 transposase [Trichonephila clavipes]
MSKSKELSEFDRGSIVGCHLCGKSVREIADILQKSKSTVSDVIVKWKRRGSETAEKQIGISVNSRTVRREIKNLGFHGRAAAHKPNITPQNAKHRLQWCRAHRHWTVDMWETVLWSDESRFTVWESGGCVWVWWMPGERFFSDCIVLTVKFGGGSIMVWGCFSWFGLGPLIPVIGNMNSEICQVIYSQFGLAIHQNDHQARRRFVEWAQTEIAVVPDFHKRILFSDEAHFWLKGYVNKQNGRIWSEANPQVYVEAPLHPEKLTVWCALWAGGILLQKR